jgi:hypothetical protein
MQLAVAQDGSTNPIPARSAHMCDHRKQAACEHLQVVTTMFAILAYSH